mmetsp:Transcript_47886/g.147700  ORF Transcript_47886/g.147700 Transcript_47886/m.147700 type:complete len:288 (-) Transcript_47886:1195-2058(-)
MAASRAGARSRRRSFAPRPACQRRASLAPGALGPPARRAAWAASVSARARSAPPRPTVASPAGEDWRSSPSATWATARRRSRTARWRLGAPGAPAARVASAGARARFSRPAAGARPARRPSTSSRSAAETRTAGFPSGASGASATRSARAASRRGTARWSRTLALGAPPASPASWRPGAATRSRATQRSTALSASGATGPRVPPRAAWASAAATGRLCSTRGTAAWAAAWSSASWGSAPARPASTWTAAGAIGLTGALAPALAGAASARAPGTWSSRRSRAASLACP